jgi:predicted phosphate transport protein (TIGR00153 family)
MPGPVAAHKEIAVARLSAALIGRDQEYFRLFEQASRNNLRAADLLDRMLSSYPESAGLASEIRACEHEGDRITHDIVQRLNQTFVTPIEREDILALASALDDVVDLIDEVADYLGLYQIEAPIDQATRLAHIVAQACRALDEAMPLLRDFREMSQYTVEVHRLENDGDRVTREAIGALFAHGIDPITVIRWKDIYERIEGAIDSTERVALLLEGIVIKNA